MDIITLSGYAGPPVIGAFIGYLTNKIAIKMLFRPLKQWKIAGVRVPMTPGVIPAKRFQLAENIGEMVGEHLLTSKEIGQALSNEPFQEHLNELTQERASELLNKELGPISTFIPDNFTAHYKVAVQIVKKQIETGLKFFLEDSASVNTLRTHLVSQLAQISEKEIKDLVGQDARELVYDSIASVLMQILASPNTQQHLSEYIQVQIITHADNHNSLKTILPDGVEEFFAELIKSQAPTLLDSLGRKVGEPEIRKELIAGIIKGIDHFIESLGSVGAMAKGFIDINNVETTLNHYLDEKENDICDWLQKDNVRKHVEEVLATWINRFFNQPVSNIIEGAGEEELKRFCDFFAIQLLQVITKGDNKQLADFLKNAGEAWLSDESVSISAITKKVAGQSEFADITEMVADNIISLLRSRGAVSSIPVITESAIDSLLEKPVGKLGNIIPASVHQGVAEYAVLTINRVLLKEVPGLVKSLHINNMVTEKVNSLDLLKLERLLLSIMEEQFKYINLFGALLGFVIGCFNLLLLRFI